MPSGRLRHVPLDVEVRRRVGLHAGANVWRHLERVMVDKIKGKCRCMCDIGLETTSACDDHEKQQHKQQVSGKNWMRRRSLAFLVSYLQSTRQILVYSLYGL